MDLKSKIRNIPDFPKKGIVFRDITPLIRDKEAFKYAIDEMARQYEGKKIDAILGAEARGFIFGAALAYKISAGFIPVRKPGKLPYKTIKRSYDLEYGSDSVEIHEDALINGTRVLLVDDLIATGGTARAAADLIKEIGGELVGIAFLVELSFLKGSEKLPGENLFSLLKY